MRIELRSRDANDPSENGYATNADGRTDAPLLAGDDVLLVGENTN